MELFFEVDLCVGQASYRVKLTLQYKIPNSNNLRCKWDFCGFFHHFSGAYIALPQPWLVNVANKMSRYSDTASFLYCSKYLEIPM